MGIVKTNGSLVAFMMFALAACSAGAPSAEAEADADSIATASTAALPTSTPSAAPDVSLVPCPSGGTAESPITLTAEEALSCDLAAMAEGSGTTIEEEYDRYRISLILDSVTTQLSEERPDVFLGAALPNEPGGAPTIYVKGPADTFIRDLVAGAGIEIAIADNQPYSAVELDERQSLVSQALLDMGFSNFSGGADIRTGRMDFAVTIEPGLPDTPEEIIDQLPADLRSGVTITVSATPVAVDTIPE